MASKATLPFQLFSDKGCLWLEEGGCRHRFNLKGVNWFGCETSTFCVHGLWQRPLRAFVDFLAGERFNALRVPVSAELALSLDAIQPNGISFEANPQLQGLSAGDVLDAVIAEAQRAGLLVMLDMHHLGMADGITELWYSEKYPESAVVHAWELLVKRYAKHWNVFAVDLKNEPHGRASWGTGDEATDWRLAAERIGAAVLVLEPRLLVFVEGVGGNCCPVATRQPAFWGGALDSAAAAPVRLPVPEKLVFSPHVYGPDVHMQSYFRSERFPDNLPADVWEPQWAHLASAGGAAVVLGEWGGFSREGSMDCAWQDRLAAFLIARGLSGGFYWCLNCNSGDTGGLLEDDWATPVRDKLDRLARICPCPSRLEVDSSGRLLHVHIAGGGGSRRAEAPPKLPATVHAAPHAAECTNPAGRLTPAAAAQKPSPTATLRLETRRVHGWADAQGRAYHQLELRLANDSGAAVPDVIIACPACEVQALWNVRERAAGDPGPAGQGDAGQAWIVCEPPEAGPPLNVGSQSEPGYSWKQFWRRRPQPGDAGLQVPAGSRSQGACGDSSVRAAGLPAWMLEQGGLPCGGELVFGGIFFTGEPSISVAPS